MVDKVFVIDGNIYDWDCVLVDYKIMEVVLKEDEGKYV